MIRLTGIQENTMARCPNGCGRIVLAPVIMKRQDGWHPTPEHPDVCYGGLKCLTLALALARQELADAAERAELAEAGRKDAVRDAEDAEVKRDAALADAARLRAAVAEPKWFPLQSNWQDRGKAGAHPTRRRIPWDIAEKAYGAYAARYGSGQSIERMAERGGFSNSEMDLFYPAWREEADENARLRAALAATPQRGVWIVPANPHPEGRWHGGDGDGWAVFETEGRIVVSSFGFRHVVEVCAALLAAAERGGSK